MRRITAQDSIEPGNWASEHSDALRDDFLKGTTLAKIGKEINAGSGRNYTRNAVIGRPKRMGLAAPGRASSPPIAPHLSNGPFPQYPLGTGNAPKTPLEPAEPAQLRCVGIRPPLVSMVALEPGDCRYPYGGGKDGEPIVSCGHPWRPGSSYCTAHFHLTSGSDMARTTGPVMLQLVTATGTRSPRAGIPIFIVLCQGVSEWCQTQQNLHVKRDLRPQVRPTALARLR
jgi:GcrA cell cycle regulator